MFSKTLLKVICVFSFILGAILGVVPIIPALFWTILLIQMFLVAPFIIIYLKKLKLVSDLDVNKCIFIGGISGAVSFLGFSVTFFPIAFIIDLIFKVDSLFWVNVVVKNFAFLIPMILLIAFLSAIMNMFSGFITLFFCEQFGKNN